MVFSDGTAEHGYYSGAGSPEGVVQAHIGSLYTDTATGLLFIKTTAVGLATGWSEFDGDTPDTAVSVAANEGSVTLDGWQMTFGSTHGQMRLRRTSGSRAIVGTVQWQNGAGTGATNRNATFGTGYAYTWPDPSLTFTVAGGEEASPQ